MKNPFFLIAILTLSSWQSDLFGQTENERTIYLMRAKQFYASGVKMDIMINGERFHRLKNGNRLIVRTNSNDTLNLQIIYPLQKKQKSEVLQITPNSENEIYIDLCFCGVAEFYNPLKHAGPVRGPHGDKPNSDVNPEITKMTKEEGVERFNQSEKFKDNKKILEKRFP